MSWFKNPLDFAEGLLDQVDKRVSSVVGPSSHDGDSESPARPPVRPGVYPLVDVCVVHVRTASYASDSASKLRTQRLPSVSAEPQKSAWDEQSFNIFDKVEPKRASPVTSPSRSPARTRSGTVKLPPRKVPTRTSPAVTGSPTVTVNASNSSSWGGEQAIASADGASKSFTSPAKQQQSEVPALRHPPARPSPQPRADRSLHAPTAASDLASSPPAAAKGTKKLSLKKATAEPAAQLSSSPAAQSETATGAPEDGAGWLSTVPKQAQQTAGSSPMSTNSSSSAAAVQPPPDTSATLHMLPRPPPGLASKPTQSPTASNWSPTAARKPAAPPVATLPAMPTSPGSRLSSSPPGSGADETKDTASSNGNGVDTHPAREPVVTQQAHRSVTAGSSPAQQGSPLPDISTDIPVVRACFLKFYMLHDRACLCCCLAVVVSMYASARGLVNL